MPGTDPIPDGDARPSALRHSADLPELKARAFAAIERAGAAGATAREIAASCLGAASVPLPVAGKIVDSLLYADRRVRATEDGRWVLRDLRAAWGGTSLLDAVFCVTDTETTGVDADARIIELGAVRVRGLELAEEFQTLVNIDRRVPPEITAMTGITEEMLASAPAPAGALEAYLGFLGEGVFCAHNAPFDRRFVWREAERFCVHRPANPVLCTRLLARRAMPELKGFSLDALSARFSIVNEMRHRALADARAAAEILVRAAGRLMEQGVSTLEEILGVQKKPDFRRFLKARDAGGKPGGATPGASPRS
ncbi:MAG: exonuclease domain-containing protein [Planctomycetes bacterium]|nr:exonuclease domain-containing protein [Planctomycetota bacterium]